MVELSKAAQRTRLLDALHEHGEVATSDARENLAIMSPAPRVLELRRLGYNIKTVFRYVEDTAGITHRQGVYIWGGEHE